MRPKLCNPSHDAHQTSSFKTLLPNLTAFKNSSRRWITGFVLGSLFKQGLDKYIYKVIYIYMQFGSMCI